MCITADDSDFVRFVSTSTGNNTSGTFEWYFDGSDVGLTRNGEDVDAIHVLANGDILISTTGGVSVPGGSGADEDLLVFTPSNLGASTAGSWAMYFDGSDVSLGGDSNRDITGVYVDGATGDIYLNTLGNFTLGSFSITDEDIFVCSPGSLGGATSCTYSFYWDGSAFGFGSEDIDGLTIQ